MYIEGFSVYGRNGAVNELDQPRTPDYWIYPQIWFNEDQTTAIQSTHMPDDGTYSQAYRVN